MDESRRLVRIDPYENLSEFIDLSRIDTETVSLLLLEHDERIDRRLLDLACDWDRADRSRMAEFRDDAALTSWCLSRIVSRSALASIIGRSPRDVSFSYGPFGKPLLPESGIYFNWAHAPGCLVLAVSRGCDLGCDVEDSLRLDANVSDVSESCYVLEERRWIDESESPDVRWMRFLGLFVEKEARLKAKGVGLSDPLCSVPGTLRDIPFSSRDVTCFRCGSGRRYVAALCLLRTGAETAGSVSRFDFREYRLTPEDLAVGGANRGGDEKTDDLERAAGACV